MAKQFFFGAGNLYGIDNAAGTPTPVKFGTLQDVAIEFSGTTKELHGDKQFPAHIGRGKSKITGKAKTAEIKAALIAALYFGIAKTTGEVLAAQDEAGSIPNDPGPYTITVANAANFHTDLGVRFTATGVPLTKVAAAPTTGQYAVSVATGVYTFAAADKQLAVLIDYLYNSAATGSTITITNQSMGLAPSFKAILTGKTDNKTTTLILNKCVSSKLSLPTKNEDHVIMEFDFEAQADDADQIGLLSVTE